MPTLSFSPDLVKHEFTIYIPSCNAFLRRSFFLKFAPLLLNGYMGRFCWFYDWIDCPILYFFRTPFLTKILNILFCFVKTPLNWSLNSGNIEVIDVSFLIHNSNFYWDFISNFVSIRKILLLFWNFIVRIQKFEIQN